MRALLLQTLLVLQDWLQPYLAPELHISIAWLNSIIWLSLFHKIIMQDEATAHTMRLVLVVNAFFEMVAKAMLESHTSTHTHLTLQVR